ncbi:MAG: CoB--CoM heterodisulfide reductase iron-sulfur subunit B family protein [Dehalococcoidales bacterium]
MKQYSYFPGCCMEGSARPYDTSLQAVSKALDFELIELENWNCCGSTPFGSTTQLEFISMASRNLAIAETKGLELVTACSDCYLTLNQANAELEKYPDVKKKIGDILNSVGLKYNGTVKIKHLTQVLIKDVGLEQIKSRVVKPLEGLKIASYYGCQLVRPIAGFDDPEFPEFLDRLVSVLGGETTEFPLKARCCGGASMIYQPDLALDLIHKLLESASAGGAELIVTPCPLCQTNLDGYQGFLNRKFKTNYNLPILYFTQLIGLAIGLSPKNLGMDQLVLSPKKLLNQYFAAGPQTVKGA